MSKAQAKKLQHGIYRIFWKTGGSSLASVGSDREGNRWFAATNWISGNCIDWRPVLRVERIMI